MLGISSECGRRNQVIGSILVEWVDGKVYLLKPEDSLNDTEKALLCIWISEVGNGAALRILPDEVWVKSIILNANTSVSTIHKNVSSYVTKLWVWLHFWADGKENRKMLKRLLGIREHVTEKITSFALIYSQEPLLKQWSFPFCEKYEIQWKWQTDDLYNLALLFLLLAWNRGVVLVTDVVKQLACVCCGDYYEKWKSTPVLDKILSLPKGAKVIVDAVV